MPAIGYVQQQQYGTFTGQLKMASLAALPIAEVYGAYGVWQDSGGFQDQLERVGTAEIGRISASHR
jgi:hypothetical protein